VDEQLKRRLIGASVLVALAIIFLPMLLSHKPVVRHPEKMASIPEEPARNFDPSLLQDAPPKDELPTPETPPASHAPAPDVTAAPPAPVAVKPEVKPKSKPPVVSETKPEIKIGQKAEKKPVVPKPSSSPSAWVVQVASFSSRASAEKLVKKLRKAGLDTMNPAAVTVAGKKYFRVQVGPELDKKRAQKLLPRINKISGVKGQIVRYP